MSDDLYSKLLTEIRKRGGTPQALQQLKEPTAENIISVIAQMLTRAEIRRRTHFPVTIHFGDAPRTMMAEGNYSFVDPYLYTDPYPIIGSGIVETVIELVHFNRYISSEEVLQHFADQKLRPITFPELLALGAWHPDVQLEFDVIALGSRAQYPRFGPAVPLLGADLQRKSREVRVSSWNAAIISGHKVHWTPGRRFGAIPLDAQVS